jgi:hypothetical protein
MGSTAKASHGAALQRCRNLLKRDCTRRSDNLIIELLMQRASTLEAVNGISTNGELQNLAPVIHSLDLALDSDNDTYVLSSVYLELAKLHAKRGDLDEAEKFSRRCLLLFPQYISGLVERAQVNHAAMRKSSSCGPQYGV